MTCRSVSSLTYEPGRFRLNEAWIALVSFATLAFVLFVAVRSPWRYLAAILAVAAAPWAVRRAFRIRLVVTEDRIVVDNYWKRHELTWPEVEGVGVSLKGVLPQPALGFKLRSGGAVFAQAT